MFKDYGRFTIFRYVDDFPLLGGTAGSSGSSIMEMVNAFRACWHGLTFTHEGQKEGALQFIDTRLSFLDEACLLGAAS